MGSPTGSDIYPILPLSTLGKQHRILPPFLQSINFYKRTTARVNEATWAGGI
ncbi:hypothetical protein ACRALDRAFT_1062567 [Sodiomyces alcalophilus JCM 7366]|uniref:uncharacterized protein n=1 Tax=Sodiomyces alcalophilus JCM 7366 TaxID=591952 RepID=UPI0039B5BB71